MLLYKVFILTKLVNCQKGFPETSCHLFSQLSCLAINPLNITVMAGGCNLEPLPVFGSTQHRLGTLMLLPLMLHSRSEWDSKDCNFAQPSIGASPKSPTHICTISTFSCSLPRPVQEIDLGCSPMASSLMPMQ